MTRQGSRHHLIVVASIEGFGDYQRRGPQHWAIRDGLYAVMAAAFPAAGTTWEDCYWEDRGDAVFALVPGETDKAVFVEVLLPGLVARLRVHNETHPEPQRIRLRMALHAGEVGYDTHGVTSTSLTLAFRLCNAPPLKSALAESPGVLAVIASDSLFEEVIRHAPATAPNTWRPVKVKETAKTGWVILPDHPYRSDPVSAKSRSELPARPRPRSGAAVPRQLPAAVRDFTGRVEHLAALDALIPPDSGHRHSDQEAAQSVVITAIDGAGGIGKTALALHWAHRIQERFPDGTLHINLRGYGPGDPTTPDEALGGFLRALGVAARAIPAGVEAQAALLRSLLAGKRLLMMLDNAHSAEQVRHLLPGTAGCMVVVTSRDSLTGLVITDAAHRLTLDLLTTSEALHLVTGILGVERVTAEPDAVGELIRLCARLPLALRIAASRAATQPYLAIADVVAELADDRTRLDILSETTDKRAAVRAVFEWSYQQLPAAQARLFRRLGLNPGPDLSLPSAAALAEQSPADTRSLLAALAAAHLIEPAAGGRYRFHDLLRVYAAEQADRHDTADERDHALESLLTWYGHTACTADRQLYSLFARVPVVVAKPNFPHRIADSDEAWAWLTAERTNILATLQYAADHQLDHHTISLARACLFLDSAGSPQEQIDAFGLGAIAARRAGSQTQAAYLLLGRGHTASRLGWWDQAQTDFGQAETLTDQVDDVTLTVFALSARGLLSLQQNRFEEAVRYFDSALPLSKGIDSEHWEAVAEGNLCTAHTGLGNYQLALEHGERGLCLRRQVGDSTGEAVALTHLAHAWRGLGDLGKAIALCREAIAIGRSLPRNRDETLAEPLDVLATWLHELGHASEAFTCWHEAATVYDDTGYSRQSAEVRRRLHDAQTSQ